jgi:hypothetical protein
MGGASKGAAGQAQSNITANSQALTGIAQQQMGQSTQLFNSAFPGFQSAENFYGALSSGDPTAIARAIAPATQQINQATVGAKQNIMNNDPSGGEKNLALEQANVSQGAQVGSTASQGYLNSFNALAKLAGQGVGESQSGANVAQSAYGTSNTGNYNAGQLGIQQKGATLGALGGLAGDATQLGTAGIGASAAGKGAAGGAAGGAGGIGAALGKGGMDAALAL